MTQAEQIQGILRERVTDLDNHILTKEGVYAEINLEEGGLNEAEGSYGGVHPNTWNEYKETFALQVTLEKPADFENITPEAAATHIVNFKNWYFQKPPKQNFFELPSLLWLVACDNAYLAPAPVISRIQILCGDPKPDGIWGSGTTELVKGFFHEKTVPRIVNFAKELTDLMVKRYEELGGYDAYADSAPHWIERCKRKLQMLYDYVTKQNELADAREEARVEATTDDVPVEVAQPKALPAEMASQPVESIPNLYKVEEEQPAPEQAPVDLTPLVEKVDTQSNDIDALGLCIVAQSETINTLAKAVETQTVIGENLTEAQGEQANLLRSQVQAIIQLKDAVLSHTTAQEQILKKLLEDTDTDEQPPAKQPTAGRDLLNEVPDSLVQS